MVTEVKNQLARALAAALLFGCSGGVARAAETDPPYTTRYLGPTGEVLPHDYRPNPESITYFVIHGFRASGQAEPFLRLARAIATRIPNANVVIVDWSVPAQKPTQGNFFGSVVNVYGQYQQSAKTARYIGTDIADWMKKHGVSPAQTVMCGHSLGAQIAAFASEACAESDGLGQRVQAILAADPAGPGFSGKTDENRLDKSDANEVIVIHTTELFGDPNAIGTVDIYVQWPDSGSPDYCAQHSQARDLLTESFLQPGMANEDGTPFGINALASAGVTPGVFMFRPNGTSPQAQSLASLAASEQQTPRASLLDEIALSRTPQE